METEEVLLDEVSDDIFNEALSDSIVYPCVFISGLETEEEFLFFKRRGAGEPHLPLYCDVEGRVVRLGEFELSLNSLLAVRQVYSYGITVHKNREEQVEINLDDPVELEKFIHL